MPPRRSILDESSSFSAAGPALPAYEPPHLPLTVSQAQNLQALARDTENLQKTILAALEVLSNAAGDLGERTPVNGGGDDNDDDDDDENPIKGGGERSKQTIAQQQKILDSIEEMARRLVDASVEVKDYKAVVSQLAEGSFEGARLAAPMRRRIRQRVGDALDSDDDDAEGPDGEAERLVSVEEGLWAQYKAGVQRRKESYEQLGMREKYGNVKEYVDFRRMLWDSQHPNEPMPNVRHWFDVQSSNQEGAADEAEDSELEIAQEKQSFNCPLTLKMFEHPVTSTICPHSFEKAAIFEMIQTARPRGSVKCPVPGCTKTLTVATLKMDRILERKVKRERERQEQEKNWMDEDEDENENGDNADEGQRLTNIKTEKVNKKGKRTRTRTVALESDVEELDNDEDE
ncbi:hypothetical protein RUND412_000798 [Rhizina undulata]